MKVQKYLALLMIFGMAATGLFAADSPDSAGPVTATLRATVGDDLEFFKHGFINSSGVLVSTLEVANAFQTDPEFTYKYDTNTRSAFTSTMTITDFTQSEGSGVVKIANVYQGGEPITPTDGAFALFSLGSTGEASSARVERSNATTIRVVPASGDSIDTDYKGETIGEGETKDSAGPGSYSATVSINVTST